MRPGHGAAYYCDRSKHPSLLRDAASQRPEQRRFCINISLPKSLAASVSRPAPRLGHHLQSSPSLSYILPHCFLICRTSELTHSSSKTWPTARERSTRPEVRKAICARTPAHHPVLTTTSPPSLDHPHHKHSLSLGPRHPGLLAQEAQVRLPSRRPLYRYLPPRGPRRPRRPRHPPPADQVPAAHKVPQGLQQRPPLLRLLEQAHPLQPRPV